MEIKEVLEILKEYHSPTIDGKCYSEHQFRAALGFAIRQLEEEILTRELIAGMIEAQNEKVKYPKIEDDEE